MLNLPGNCRAGKFSVHPSNWKSPSANKNIHWRISYWFYDDNLGQRKKVVIKGMNRVNTLKEKQDSVEALLEDELSLIQKEGWNPITKKYTKVEVPAAEEEPADTMSLRSALTLAYENIEVTADTKSQIKSVLKYFLQAAEALKYDQVPLASIKRRNIKKILDHIGKLKEQWTNSNYNNHFRYISSLFNYLVTSADILEANPLWRQPKKPVVVKERETLTREQRTIISDYLREHYYRFWLYMQIFFHSGSRTKELLRLKAADVDLPGQRFKITILKGKAPREVWRPIKDIAVPFWMEALQGAAADDHVFSKGLVPGKQQIRAEQIDRRWKRHVKGTLGIEVDFYPLKHLNLDEIAEALGTEDAAGAAAHTTPVITLKHYLKGEKKRQQGRIKKVGNSFD